jgi:hypothetical protein
MLRLRYDRLREARLRCVSIKVFFLTIERDLDIKLGDTPGINMSPNTTLTLCYLAIDSHNTHSQAFSPFTSAYGSALCSTSIERY